MFVPDAQRDHQAAQCTALSVWLQQKGTVLACHGASPAFLAPADKTVQLCSELAQKIDPVFPETSPQHRFFFFNFLIQLAALAFNAHTALSAHSHMQRELGPALWQRCGMFCPGHLLQQK